MTPRTLTDRFLRTLSAPSDGRATYRDDKLPGFGVRVAPTGRVSFFLRYRTGTGKRRRKTLGTYPALSLAQARKDAKALIGDAARGEDPVEEERRQGVTFRRFALDVYMEKHAKPNKRSWKGDLRKLKKDILPRIGDLPLSDVRRPHLVEILDAIAGRGSPVQARRTRALLSKIFKLAMERGEVDQSPAHGLPSIVQERPRHRVLSNGELAALWWALSDEAPVVATAFRVLILTGQRSGEVLGMRAEELDAERRWWTLPPERTKNRLEHRVPLSDQVRGVLQELERFTGPPDPWVFPSAQYGPQVKAKARAAIRRGERLADVARRLQVPASTVSNWKATADQEPTRREGGHLRWLQSAVERLRERTGIEDFRAHDLRRTVATRLSELGTSRLVLMKVLNHKDQSVTGRYDRHAYSREKRKALDQWGEEVSRIVWGSALAPAAGPSEAEADPAPPEPRSRARRTRRAAQERPS